MAANATIRLALLALAAPWAALSASLGPAAAQIQIVPGQGTVIPAPHVTNGLPVIVRPLPSPDTLARERQLRNRIIRERIGARHIRPDIPAASMEPDGRGRMGRPDLDPARAGDFSRGGPTAIGRSSVTRPSLAPRR